MSEIRTFGLENPNEIQFGRLFGYTINVRNLNVRLVESINQKSEIRTKWFGFQTTI